MKTFAESLYRCLEDARFFEFRDNYDEFRFGPRKPAAARAWVAWQTRRVCRRFGFYHRNWLRRPDPAALSEWMARIPDLEWLYARLADDASRSLLVNIIAFRIMGYLGVRLPLGDQTYRRRRQNLKRLADPDDSIDIHFKGWRLNRYDLTPLGYPLSLYIINPMTLFVVDQYADRQRGIAVKDGDTVIDGGGCYGDTALYFAHHAGPTGSVHTFEFVPSNLRVLKKNLSLNAGFQERVVVVEKALWDKTGLCVHIMENGPGSRLSMDARPGYDVRSETISIDDHVRGAGLNRVDFIKLDIEGAEENALVGAERTIRHWRPTLAVSLYHSPSDFVRLPRLIDRYCPEYRFYIKHATMHSEETVLFAKMADA